MLRSNLHGPVVAALFIACDTSCAQQNISWALLNFSDRLEVHISFVVPVDLAPRSQQTLEIYYSSTLKELLPWPKHVAQLTLTVTDR